MTNDSGPSRWSLLEIDFSDEEWRTRARHQDENGTVAERIEREVARHGQSAWVPACNGTEVPFYTRSGHRVLYCWQPSTGRHAYFDCGTDVIIPDAELLAYGLGA
jgi:hypothetical protein